MPAKTPPLAAFLSLALLATVALATGAHAAATIQSSRPATAVIGQPDLKTGDAIHGQPNRLSLALGVAYDTASGKVFVCDTDNHRVLRFASLAAAESRANPEMVYGQPDPVAHSANRGGCATATAGSLSSPGFITVDSHGRLWVADTGNNRVVGYYSAATTTTAGIAASIVLGQPTAALTTSGTGSGKMNSPYGVAVGPDDTLWVADTSNNRVLAFTAISSKGNFAPADGLLGQAGFAANSASAADIGMNTPYGLCADAAGRLWVADYGNRRVLRFNGATAESKTASPKATSVLGRSGFGEVDNTTLDELHVGYCLGVYLDAGGTLWVSSGAYCRVLGFTGAAGLGNGAAATIVLGQPDFQTLQPAPISASVFSSPWQIGGGPAGSLLVVDAGYSRVLRYSPMQPVAPPTPAKPVVKISGAKKLTTSKAKLTIKGKATGQVTSVTYQIGSKPAKKAKGAASWKFTAALKPGKNKIAVTAHGSSWDSAPAKITITRKP